MKLFKSTFEREVHIGEHVTVRGGGTVEDAATRLNIAPAAVLRLIQSRAIDSLSVRLHDGSWDHLVPDSEVQRFNRERRAPGAPMYRWPEDAGSEPVRAVSPHLVAAIDPIRHPLLHDIANGAQWFGTDDFPTGQEWADEHETWLRSIKDAAGRARYVQRLKGPKERRDEAFAEVAVAYFLTAKCGISVLKWEPRGANRTLGEFLMGFDAQHPVFFEVKSPGWESEIARDEGQTSPRLQQPKYIDADGRATAPWAAVRHAVTKAYPKLPGTMPTILVVNDDLMVSLVNLRAMTEIGLYKARNPGHDTGYLAEDGPFVDARCERLGGVGIFNVRLSAAGVEYRFALFENPHALPAVAVPRDVARRLASFST